MIITIDGPSVSGKSTIARLLAQELDYFFLNTGMLYRGFAYAVLHEHLDYVALTDTSIAHIISRLTYRWDTRASMLYKGIDITGKLDQPAIDVASSRISVLSAVRKHIDAWQHALVDAHNSVIDGRDSGSVVFVHAEHKFYITASDDVRAKRWAAKQHALGNSTDLENALKQVQARDQRDMHREVAPLVVPLGAKIIFNDGNDPAAVVVQIMQCTYDVR